MRPAYSLLRKRYNSHTAVMAILWEYTCFLFDAKIELSQAAAFLKRRRGARWALDLLAKADNGDHDKFMDRVT